MPAICCCCDSSAAVAVREDFATRDTSSGNSIIDPSLTHAFMNVPPHFASSSLATADWPTEAANRLQLRAPSACKVSAEHCVLQYDTTKALLLVVTSTSTDDNRDGEQILDIIDPDDMIGVKLEIQTTDRFGAPRSTSQASAQGEENTFIRATNEPTTDGLADSRGSALLTLFVYPRKDPSKPSFLNRYGVTTYKPKPDPKYARPTADTLSKLGFRHAHHRTFKLAPTEDLQDCSTVVAALRKLCSSQQPSAVSPLRYLIVVNPQSGPKRSGGKLCETQVQPMLEQAGIEVDVCITTHPNHAQERMAKSSTEEDIAGYDGLVLMGGDGVVHEAYNGLFARADKDELLKKLKIGVIGCGSCNGFSTSLAHGSHERYGIVAETFLVAKGQSCWHDTSRYQTTTKSYSSFLTFSWAIIADIDIESEVLHWLGEPRNDIWAVLRILALRRYQATFSYLPATEATADNTITMPALSDPVPSTWTTVEDGFYLFWASHVTHAAMHTYHSPNSKFQDGIFEIMIVRGRISRYRMTRILLALESGNHVGMPGVEFVQCVAYRLVKETPGSFNDIDGEAVEDGPIQAQVQPHSVQVFCNPKFES